MKRLSSFHLMLIVSAFIMLSRISPAQDKNLANPQLDDFFRQTISNYNYVALGACLIKDQNIIWQNSYGCSDLGAGKALRHDDIFQLASLSKTITATALMQLYDKGLFNLDDDVNKFLSFKVRNPNYPDKPITFRMLLTHTAGFDDLLPMGNKISLGVWGDSPIPFREYVESLFTPGGKYYSADYFSKTLAPGDSYKYSNISFSLIGYLVEVLSGKDFEQYCRENIFTPMGMLNTSWHLKGLDTTRIVAGYGFPDSTGNYLKVRPFGTPGYPEGMLRTTMNDLSHFIMACINEGKYNDYQMLKPETMKLMVTPQGVKNVSSRSHKMLDMGLSWDIFDVDGDTLYSMNGFSGSIFTAAYFSPEIKSGFIYFFTGITMKNMQGVIDITSRLYKTLKNYKQEL